MPLEKSSNYTKKIKDVTDKPQNTTDKDGVGKYINDVADFLHSYIENTGNDNGSKETKNFETQLKNGTLLQGLRDVLPKITSLGTFNANNFEADAKTEYDKYSAKAKDELVKANQAKTPEEQSEALVTVAMYYYREALWRFAAYKNLLNNIPQQQNLVLGLVELGQAFFNAANTLDQAAAMETGRKKKEAKEIDREKLVAKRLFEAAKEIFTLIINKFGPGLVTIGTEKADKICNDYIDASNKGIARN